MAEPGCVDAWLDALRGELVRVEARERRRVAAAEEARVRFEGEGMPAEVLGRWDETIAHIRRGHEVAHLDLERLDALRAEHRPSRRAPDAALRVVAGYALAVALAPGRHGVPIDMLRALWRERWHFAPPRNALIRAWFTGSAFDVDPDDRIRGCLLPAHAVDVQRAILSELMEASANARKSMDDDAIDRLTVAAGRAAALYQLPPPSSADVGDALEDGDEAPHRGGVRRLAARVSGVNEHTLGNLTRR